MPWYVWGQLAIGCLVVELLMPGGYFVLCFGLSSLLVAGLSAFGVIESPWTQTLVLAIAAAGALTFLRPLLMRRARRHSEKTS